MTTADVTTAEDAKPEDTAAAQTELAGTKLARFRVVSLAEGVSFLLLLCVAMPLKYAAHMPAATMVAGMVHGLLFLAYVALAYGVKQTEGWNAKRFLVVLVASVIPTGPFWLHKSLKK